MIKLIIDINVLVSALIQRNYFFLVVDFVLMKRQVELCLSKDLLKEYIEVLNRIKFFKYPGYEIRSNILISDIEKVGAIYFPSAVINILNDSPDNRLLELAETCKANYLITGNTRHFSMSEYKQTRIVSPREFWEIEITNTND
ncbi:MAG: putative toxin-antitoxin system toxin component, PIN family [Ginsengibacter sp.]